MTTETKIDTGTDELLCVIRDRVAIITLNRPEARNAMSDNLTPALRHAVVAALLVVHRYLQSRHSGAMRSIELRCAIAHLRISRFRGWCLRTIPE